MPSQEEYQKFVQCPQLGGVLDLTDPRTSSDTLPPCVAECTAPSIKVGWQCVRKASGSSSFRLQFILHHVCQAADCTWLADWNTHLQIIGIKLCQYLGVPFQELQGAILFWPVDTYPPPEGSLQLEQFFIARQGEGDYPGGARRKLQSGQWHLLYMAFRIDSRRISQNDAQVRQVASGDNSANRELSTFLGFDVVIRNSFIGANPGGAAKQFFAREEYTPVYKFRGFAMNENPFISTTPDPAMAHCIDPCYDYDEELSPKGPHQCESRNDCMCAGSRYCSDQGYCNGDEGGCSPNTTSTTKTTTTTVDSGNLYHSGGYICTQGALRANMAGASQKAASLQDCLERCNGAPTCIAAEWSQQMDYCFLVAGSFSDADVATSQDTLLCVPLLPVQPQDFGMTKECRASMANYIAANIPEQTNQSAVACGILNAGVSSAACLYSACSSNDWFDVIGGYCIDDEDSLSQFKSWKGRLCTTTTTTLRLTTTSTGKLRGNVTGRHPERMAEGKASPSPIEADGGSAARIGIIVFIAVVIVAVGACLVRWYTRIKSSRVVPVDFQEDMPEMYQKPEKPEKNKKDGGLLGRYAEAIRAEKERSAGLSGKPKEKTEKKEKDAEHKNPYERFERMKERQAQNAAPEDATEPPNRNSRHSSKTSTGDKSSEDEGFGDPRDWQQHRAKGTSQPESGGGTPIGKRQSAPYSSTNAAGSKENVGGSFFNGRASAPQQNTNYEDMPGWKEAYSKRFGAADDPPSDGPRAAGAAGKRESAPYASTGAGARENPRSKSPPPKENRERSSTGPTPAGSGYSGNGPGPRAAGTGGSAPPPSASTPPPAKAPTPQRQSTKSAASAEATDPNELADQLNQMKTSLDATERKKVFAKLCLRWHPDKNSDNVQHATAMFQMLQEKKDWFLKET